MASTFPARSILKAAFLPLPENALVLSHPVKACKPGRAWHTPFPSRANVPAALLWASVKQYLCRNLSSKWAAYHSNVSVRRAYDNNSRSGRSSVLCMQERARVSLFLVAFQLRNSHQRHCLTIGVSQDIAAVATAKIKLAIVQLFGIPWWGPLGEEKINHDSWMLFCNWKRQETVSSLAVVD